MPPYETARWTRRPPRLRYIIRARWLAKEIPGDETVLDSEPELTIEWWTPSHGRRSIHTLPHTYADGALLVAAVKRQED